MPLIGTPSVLLDFCDENVSFQISLNHLINAMSANPHATCGARNPTASISSSNSSPCASITSDCARDTNRPGPARIRPDYTVKGSDRSGSNGRSPISALPSIEDDQHVLLLNDPKARDFINGECLQDPSSMFPFHKERNCNEEVSKLPTWRRLSASPRRKAGTTLASYLPRQSNLRGQPRVMTEATPFGSAQQLVTLAERQDELDTSNVLREVRDNAEPSDKEASLLTKLGKEFRKIYCPRETPPLVLPSAPSEEEKYSYVDMSRRFLFSCVGLAFLAVAARTVLFARSSPYHCWFIIYALITEIWLLASLWIAVFGGKFDVPAHNKLVQDFPLTEKGAPTVDIYLPICKEALQVIENAWNHVAALKYPDSRLAVFALDDGGEKAVQSLAERFHFKYICRPNRPELKKAGNLRYAFQQTSGELFAVFDADFCPRPDFLLETVPHLLADEKHAIKKTHQYFRSSPSQTWILKVSHELPG